MNNISVISEIQVYIFTLEQQKRKFYSDFKELQDDLKKEFDIDVSINSLRAIYEPLIEEDQLDLSLLYNNIMC